jgi:hypothetical protein
MSRSLPTLTKPNPGKFTWDHVIAAVSGVSSQRKSESLRAMPRNQYF